MFPAGSEKGQHERFKARSVLSANVNPTAPTSVADVADTGAGSAVRAASLWSLIILFPLKNSECLAVSFHTMSDNGKKDKSESTGVCLAVYLLLFGKKFENVFWGIGYTNDLGAPSTVTLSGGRVCGRMGRACPDLPTCIVLIQTKHHCWPNLAR